MKKLLVKCTQENSVSKDSIKLLEMTMTFLPPHQKELFEVRKEERVIADYIAAMTDRYAMKTYHEIYGLSL